jgi:hypothetical protein
MTTDAAACASPSPNVPVVAGTVTLKPRSDPMQVSGNDACPEPCGCRTVTTASTTLQRSGHDASTPSEIERPSGASSAAEPMSTVGPVDGRAPAGAAVQATSRDPSAHSSVTTKFAVATASKRWNVSTAAVAGAAKSSAPRTAAAASQRAGRRVDVVGMEHPFPRVTIGVPPYVRGARPACAPARLSRLRWAALD